MKRYNTGIIILTIGGIVASVALIGLMGVFASDVFNKTPLYIICLVGLLIGIPLAIAGYSIAHQFTNSVKMKMSSYFRVEGEENPDYLKEIETVRENFAADTDPDKNKTLDGFGPNKKFYDRSVIATGKIRYGYLVEANSEMFRFKDLQTVAMPGVVIYSTDDYFDSHPLALKQIANTLFANKHSNILRNELKYFTAQRVSDELTGGREVYMTTIMFYRLHLPLGYLSDSLMPLVADPSCPAAFVVDVKYWTNPLIGNFVHGHAMKHDDEDIAKD